MQALPPPAAAAPAVPPPARPKRQLKTISPSRIVQFSPELGEGCKRAWGFRVIDGITTPSKPSARLGTRVHTLQDDYLRKGLSPDWGETMTWPNPHDPSKMVIRYPGILAAAGHAYLPPPGSGIVEQQGRFVREDIQFDNRIDYHEPPSPARHNLVYVLDHKTSADPKKYAHTPETLQTDVQAILYAAWALQAYPDAAGAWLCWLYYETGGKDPKRPKVIKVEVILRRPWVESQLDRIMPVAREMLRTHAEVSAARYLPPNLAACTKFGGCDYQTVCTVDPAQRQEYLAMELAQSAASVSAPSFADWFTAAGWMEHPQDPNTMYRAVERTVDPSGWVTEYRSNLEAEHAKLVEAMKAPQVAPAPAPEAPPPPPPPMAPPAPPVPAAPALAAPLAPSVPAVPQPVTINPPEAPVPSPELPPVAPEPPKPETRYVGFDKSALQREATSRGMDIARKREAGLLEMLTNDDLSRRRLGMEPAPLVGGPAVAPQAAPPAPPAPPIPAPVPPPVPSDPRAQLPELPTFEAASYVLDDRADFWGSVVLALLDKNASNEAVERACAVADYLLGARDHRFPKS